MRVNVIITIACILMVMTTSCQSEEQFEFYRYYSSGSLLYQNRCQNCHGVNGEGLLKLIPPLTDPTYLKANKAGLACTVKSGLKDKIIVSGKTYEGIMPANELTHIEIAQVLTYITNSFNNKLGIINAQQVTDSLQKCN